MDINTRNFLLLKLAEAFGVIAVLMIASTSSKMTFRPVEFKYPKREGRISSGLFIVLFLVSYFFYSIGVDINLPLDAALNPLSKQLVLAIVCLGITAAVLFYRRQPLLSAGWGRKQNLTLGLRLGVMLIFLTIFLPRENRNDYQWCQCAGRDCPGAPARDQPIRGEYFPWILTDALLFLDR